MRAGARRHNIETTPDGRATTDQLLPGIRTIERSLLSALAHDERAHLLDLLTKILARTADVAAGPPEPSTASASGPLVPRQDTEPGPPANPRHCHSRASVPPLKDTRKPRPASLRHAATAKPDATRNQPTSCMGALIADCSTSSACRWRPLLWPPTARRPPGLNGWKCGGTAGFLRQALSASAGPGLAAAARS